MRLNYNRLAVGDRLVREKGGIFSRHHVLYAGYDSTTNQRLVAENQSGYGVRVITLSQFLNEGRLVRVEYNNYSYSDQKIIIQRINQRLGWAYDWFTYNCEHFVNEVLHGEKSSKQVQTGVGMGIAGFLALVFIGD